MNDNYREVFEEVSRRIKKADKKRIIVAIDGKSGSGKTTLAKVLSEQFDCNIFHMDDFFLRSEQRTKARLEEVGGNVDYERFFIEVLQPVIHGESVCYRPFSCKSMELMEEITVLAKRLTVIEGSYSMHPYFEEYYDVAVFMTMDEKAQIEVIRKRNGETMLSRFITEWIPKENAYFDKFDIRKKSSIVIMR